MSGPAIPPGAVRAVAIVLHDEACDDTATCGRWNSKVPGYAQHHIGYYEDRAREVLEAAEAAWPHERDRVLALAREYHAIVPAGEGSRAKWASFADLIETLDAKEAPDGAQ